MRARIATLAGCVLAVTAGMVAFADAGFGKGDKDQSSAMTLLAMADAAPFPDRGPGAPPLAAPPRPGPRGFHGRPPLARILSEQETAIGIRASQLDAWRDYADAVQAMMTPPQRPSPDARAGAFALPQAMVEDVMKRAEAARKVQAAIDTLRKTLTPEQLERAATLAPPPPGPHSGGDERGPGPAPHR